MIDLIASFIIALLSGLGVGSGGLLVVWLSLRGEVGQVQAQGMNLLFFLFSSGAALLVNLTRRRIFWHTVGWMVLAGIPGTLIGSYLAHHLDADTVRTVFGLMLIASGIISLRRRKDEKSSQIRKEKM